MNDKERRRHEKQEALKIFCAGLRQLREEQGTRLAEAGISSDDEATRLYLDGKLSLEKYDYLLHGKRKYSQAEVRAFCRRLNKIKQELLARIKVAGYDSVEQVTVLYLEGQVPLDEYVRLLDGDDCWSL